MRLSTTIAVLTMVRMTRNKPICLADDGNQFFHRNLFHVGVGVACRCFKRWMSAQLRRIHPARTCTSTALTLWLVVWPHLHRFSKPRHIRAVESGVGGSTFIAPADNRIVVFLELCCLRIRQRNKHHRVAAG